MKKYCLLIVVLIFQKYSIAQDMYIPSWPCSDLELEETEYSYATFTLKVLLVEFSDIKHRNPNQDNLPAYTYDDFENMLFSEGIYVSPNMYSPDNQSVFGSLRDYYKIMSNNYLFITGSILNGDDNNDNVPDWIELDHSKSYYNDGFYKDFYDEVKAKAIAEGLNVSTPGNTKLVVVYAGHAYREDSNNENHSALCPKARRYDYPNYLEAHYLISEQYAPDAPYNTEHENRKFTHIGIHAHEFGHLLGFIDLYNPENDNGRWDLMGSGNFNGPTFSGECPAPMNPVLRKRISGVHLIPVTSDIPSQQVNYSIQNPDVFQTSDASNSYFWVECRRFNQSMTIGSTSCSDYNAYLPHGSETQGVMVWRKDYYAPSGRIMHANGLVWPDKTYGNAGDLLPGTSGVKVISPWSDSRSISANNSWIPSTKPSTNCGLEIATIGNGYYVLDFYSQTPSDASPSKPQNLQVTSSNYHPYLTWDANSEPDLSSYQVLRKMDSGSWSLLATVTTNSYTDNQVITPAQQNTFYYKVRAKDTQNYYSVYSDEASIEGYKIYKNNSSPDEEANNDVPENFLLSQNYPNPFNPTTEIKFALPVTSSVRLTIYNMMGQEIKTFESTGLSQGAHQYTWNGRDKNNEQVSSGIYIYRLNAVGQDGQVFEKSAKMMLLK